ncbi:alanine dehydrogenase [Candidatus Altiarchaeota archaeon]
MTLVLSGEEVSSVLKIGDCVKAVEEAFRAYGEGKVNMPPKSYLDLDKGDFRAMYGEIKGDVGVCGMKWVNVHPGNPGKGLPTVMAVIVLNDPDTGLPLAVMDGTLVTNLRTGSAAGVATKYLARKDSEIVGFVGAGAQAITQLGAINEVISIKEAYVYDVNDDRKKEFSEKMSQQYDFQVAPAETLEELFRVCDVVSTITPVREPIVKSEWVSPGTHINAIGADAAGKQELESEILTKAKVVVDDWCQASHSGEINVPLTKGVIKQEDIYGFLGEVVAGKIKGRTDDSEITVFDSTGLIIQDLATANLALKLCEEKGLGEDIKFVEDL